MNVIITGSERGIGKELAREVCRRGGMYYGFSRWADVDVSDYKTVKDAMSGLEHEVPEALINNAGVVSIGSILETNIEDWHRQVNVNLNGVFYCCKEYARIAKETGGVIVNIASTAGLGPRPGRAAYAATKAAVISLSLSLARELKPYGIKVYCVCPGAVNTDMRKQIAPDDDFQHMLQPQDVAKFIMDLIEKGNYLDGQIIELKENF